MDDVKTLISVDPGVHACGVALWKGGKLVCARLVSNRGEDWPTMGEAVLRWTPEEFRAGRGIIEFPQQYRFTPEGVDPRDVVRLAGAAKTVIDALSQVAWVSTTPFGWKKNVPKGIMMKRIQRKLGVDEAATVVEPWPKSLEHNIYDAIGVGLFALRRL